MCLFQTVDSAGTGTVSESLPFACDCVGPESVAAGLGSDGDF